VSRTPRNFVRNAVIGSTRPRFHVAGDAEHCGHCTDAEGDAQRGDDGLKRLTAHDASGERQVSAHVAQRFAR
jgi:hypothetical protein